MQTEEKEKLDNKHEQLQTHYNSLADIFSCTNFVQTQILHGHL